MSDIRNMQQVKNRMIEERRKMQYEVLMEWDKGKMTGLQCIENIIELEKIVPMNYKIIHGDKNDPKNKGP